MPAGTTITAGQGATGIVVTWAATGSNVSVTASNNCGTGTAQTLAIAVTPAAAAAGIDQSVCADVATFAGNTPTGTGLWTLITGTHPMSEPLTQVVSLAVRVATAVRAGAA